MRLPKQLALCSVGWKITVLLPSSDPLCVLQPFLVGALLNSSIHHFPLSGAVTLLALLLQVILRPAKTREQTLFRECSNRLVWRL